MTVETLYQKLEELIPAAYSCEWDHDGLMICPNPKKQVLKVLVCLDTTEEMVDKAVNEHYDVIVCHHPYLFKGLHEISGTDKKQADCIRLLQADVSVMCFHTRLDTVKGGVNDVLAQTLGLKPDSIETFDVEGLPMGRVGNLSTPTDLQTFAQHVCQVLHVPSVAVGDSHRMVSRVAVLGGAGKGLLNEVKGVGADTYVSGELGYHELIDAGYENLSLIAADHFYTENPVTAVLQKMIAQIDATIQIDCVNSRRHMILVGEGSLT